MKEQGTFYKPEVMDLDSVIEPYQKAFEGWPWYEVSKCADIRSPTRCEGGLSKTAIGQLCGACEYAPSRPAYEPEELRVKFKLIGDTRPTSWYTEEVDAGVTLAAVAWSAAPNVIAAEKYQDVPDMTEWLETTLGEEDIVWLDEVFANKDLKQSGNLARFDSMCEGFLDTLEGTALAFRTINPAMTRAAIKNFKERALVFTRNEQVPDRRDFVVIKRNEEM
ncbi:MAG: hypothetical protein JWP06_590 [Candidatus Saccharibacteria bacterium]|nr:hypothetical protein [Candidatus Saccharibacteria bacterium]